MKTKPLWMLILCCLTSIVTYAQQDTAFFYYKFPDRIISSAEKPDFVRAIYPPDTTIDKRLFVVKDYYPNGKLKLVGNSQANIMDPLMRGPFIEFFPNGKRKSTGSYSTVFTEKSHFIGILTNYYPNGKLFSVADYLDGTKYKLLECRDTSGRLIAEKGNGKWLEYYLDFTNPVREGSIINGLEDGEWHEIKADTVNCVTIYKKGKLVSGTATVPSGKKYIFSQFDSQPQLRKNNTETFLKNNFRYQDLPIMQGIASTTYVNFDLSATGEVSNIAATKNGHEAAETEVERVIKVSAKEWTPAFKNGIPIPAHCTATFFVNKFTSTSVNGESQNTTYMVRVALLTSTIIKL